MEETNSLYQKLWFYRREASHRIEPKDSHGGLDSAIFCLKNAANLFGIDTRRDTINFLRKGRYASYSSILKAANDFGLSARHLEVIGEDVRSISFPAIIRMKDGEFCLACSIDGNRINLLSNVSENKTSILIKNFDSIFDQTAIELQPLFNNESYDEALTIQRFYSQYPSLIHNLAVILLLSLAIQLLLIAIPLSFQSVIDRVIPTGSVDVLHLILAGVGFLVVTDIIIKLVRGYFVLNFFTRINVYTLSNFSKHLFFLPITYFFNKSIGDITSRLSSVEQLNLQLSKSVPLLIIDGAACCLLLVIMVIYSPLVTGIILLGLTLQALTYGFYYSKKKKLTVEGLELHAQSYSVFVENIKIIQSMKIYQNEASRHALWTSKYVDAANVDIQKGLLDIKTEVIVGVISGIEIILLLYSLTNLLMTNVITIGMLYAYLSFKVQFSQRIDNFLKSFVDLKLLSAHLARMSDVLCRRTERDIDGSIVLRDLDDVKGELSINDVSYSYEDTGVYTFKSVNFSVPAGSSVAIVGPSGQGKTTLMKIIMGLLHPTEGKVFCDDVDILSLRNYRSSISAVTQEDCLISGTVLDNIAWSINEIDKHDNEFAIQCAKMASVHEDIMNLKDGYMTLIGGATDKVSAGQKQRILLARALYKNPKILFLDEATSNLDDKSEKIINEAIRNLSITRIMIAHKAELTEWADVVVDITKFNGVND